MTVFLAAFDKLWFHLFDYRLLFLTHGLTKFVALTSGKVSQLSGE